MSARDSLGKQFEPPPGHVRVSDVMQMKSRDHPGTVAEAISWMQSPSRLREMDAKYGVGEGRDYLLRQGALAADVAKNGVREPITLRGDTLWEGHHRVWAAHTAGRDTVPAKREAP